MGLPAPVFTIEALDLSVTFRRKTSSTVEKTVEKILVLISQDPAITTKKLQAETGLTRRGVEYHLEKLKADGKLDRIGPDKGGHWKIIK